MIRLLLDQGLPRSTVDFLPSAGWDVMHACQCGLATASDEQILQYARADDRVICTLDADFVAKGCGDLNSHPCWREFGAKSQRQSSAVRL